MPTFHRLVDRRGGLIAATLALALVVWLLTSSLLGFGLILFVPAAVAWLARR